MLAEFSCTVQHAALRMDKSCACYFLSELAMSSSNAITARALVKIADCAEQLRILSWSRPFTRNKGLACETSHGHGHGGDISHRALIF